MVWPPQSRDLYMSIFESIDILQHFFYNCLEPLHSTVYLKRKDLQVLLKERTDMLQCKLHYLNPCSAGQTLIKTQN